MKIKTMVKLKSTKQGIEGFGNNRYLIKVLSENHIEANLELIGLLSKHFGTPASGINIIEGREIEDKVIEIL